MTQDIDELDLNAYLDGELDDEARKRLEQALADDPHARRKLSELREQSATVRAAMSVPLTQPVPDDVRQRIETMLADATEGSSIAGDRPGRRSSFFPVAMAASMVIALAGMLVAFMLLEQRVDQRLAQMATPRAQDRTYYDNALAAALEDHVSGSSVSWINPDTGASGSITPVRTFKAVTDDWCREFTSVISQSGSSEARSGIACRTGDGSWQTKILVFDTTGTGGPDT